MKHCTHIFFDLDHTLWDYDFNASKVLGELYDRYSLGEHLRVTRAGFVNVFFKTNAEMWRSFNDGKIDKEGIRMNRFRRIIRACGGTEEELADELSDYFMYHCPRQVKIIEEADILLGYLENRYELSVITNGFEDVQQIKLASSGLSRFFGNVFTSDGIGHRKPSPQIFRAALESSKARKECSIMIGDNPYTDIKGAQDAGIIPILFNPDGKTRSDCQIQVSKLSELMKLL